MAVAAVMVPAKVAKVEELRPRAAKAALTLAEAARSRPVDPKLTLPPRARVWPLRVRVPVVLMPPEPTRRPVTSATPVSGSRTMVLPEAAS